MESDGPCWRVYYGERRGPYRVFLGFIVAPDEASARVRAWRLWPDHSPVRLRVERAGVCAVPADAGVPGGGRNGV